MSKKTDTIEIQTSSIAFLQFDRRELVYVLRAETPGGGGYGGVIHPSNLEKARLVGQTTANRRANFCK